MIFVTSFGDPGKAFDYPSYAQSISKACRLLTTDGRLVRRTEGILHGTLNPYGCHVVQG